MASIGDLYFTFRGDGARLTADAKKEGAAAGTVAGKGFTANMKKQFAGGELKKGLLGGLGLAGGVGVANAISGALSTVVDVAFQSIDAASNLNEAVSKSEAVFKDSADEMEAWAETASDSFGQSKRQALEAAGGFGNLIQAFGIGADKSAEMSKSLVELASDLASFNNTSVDDALIALRSGLSGETEPLKRYGIALNDVRLKEEAMRLGLIKTAKGTLPIAIKTQAAYALILKDSALAQGDFDRTSDGLANTQKSLQAAIEDTQAELGEALLPVMLELANIAKDEIVPAIRDMIAVAKEGEDVFTALGEVLGAVTSGGMSGASAYARHVERELEAVKEAHEQSVEDIEAGLKATRHDLGTTGIALTTTASTAEESFDDMGDSARDAERRTAGSLAYMKQRLAEWRDALITAARGAISKAYQIISDKAELTAVNIEKADLRKIASTRKWTSEEKARYDELTESQALLILDLAENGAENQKVVKDAIKQIEKDLKTATGNRRKALLALLATMRKLESQAKETAAAVRGVKWGGTGDPVHGGHTALASGGSVVPGGTYEVNEVGTELFSPQVYGNITSAAKTAELIGNGTVAVGSGDTHLHLQTYGLPLMARTPVEVGYEVRRAIRHGRPLAPPKRRSWG